MKTSTWIKGAALSALAVATILPAMSIAQSMGDGARGDRERPTFETLDTDGDGTVTVAEFQARGAAHFGEADTNGDGVLSAEELTAAATARAAERAVENVTKMIEWRDTDGDGALSQAEMAGNNGQRMFDRLDADGDGAISAEEFEQASNERGRGGEGRGGKHGGKHGGDHDGKGDRRG